MGKKLLHFAANYFYKGFLTMCLFTLPVILLQVSIDSFESTHYLTGRSMILHICGGIIAMIGWVLIITILGAAIFGTDEKGNKTK